MQTKSLQYSCTSLHALIVAFWTTIMQSESAFSSLANDRKMCFSDTEAEAVRMRNGLGLGTLLFVNTQLQ